MTAASPAAPTLSWRPCDSCSSGSRPASAGPGGRGHAGVQRGRAGRRPDLRGRRPRGDPVLGARRRRRHGRRTPGSRSSGTRTSTPANATLRGRGSRGSRPARIVAAGSGHGAAVGADPNGPSLPVLFREGAADHLPIRGEPPAAGEIALPAGSARPLGVDSRRDRDRDRAQRARQTDAHAQRDVRLAGPRRSVLVRRQSPFPPPDSTEPPPALMDRDGYLEVPPRSWGSRASTSGTSTSPSAGVPFDEARAVPGQLGRSLGRALQRRAGLDPVRLTTGLDTLFGIVQQRVQNLRDPDPARRVPDRRGHAGRAWPAWARWRSPASPSSSPCSTAVGSRSGTLLAAQGVQALTYARSSPTRWGCCSGMVLATLAGTLERHVAPRRGVPRRPVDAGAECSALSAAVVGAIMLLLLSLPHVRRTSWRSGGPPRARTGRCSRGCRSSCSSCRSAMFAFLQLRGRRAVDERPGRHDRPAGAAGADAAALRALVPRAPAAALRPAPARPAGSARTTAPADLPRGPPARPVPRHRVRDLAPAAARDGPAGRLDLVPRDRAAQPRGRRAPAGRRRLERADRGPRRPAGGRELGAARTPSR